jgi:hypothetical protein
MHNSKKKEKIYFFERCQILIGYPPPLSILLLRLVMGMPLTTTRLSVFDSGETKADRPPSIKC